VAESLEAVRELTGLPLPEIPAESADNNRKNCLGRPFWSALVRGGYQGALYYVENLARRHGGTEN